MSNKLDIAALREQVENAEALGYDELTELLDSHDALTLQLDALVEMDDQLTFLIAQRNALRGCLADSLRAFNYTQGGATYPEDHWSVRARALLTEATP